MSIPRRLRWRRSPARGSVSGTSSGDPSPVASRLERGRASLAAAMRAPEHERPERTHPRDPRATRWTEAERAPWRPTGLTLLVISFSLPVLVIVGFLVILAIASGRLG